MCILTPSHPLSGVAYHLKRVTRRISGGGADFANNISF